MFISYSFELYYNFFSKPVLKKIMGYPVSPGLFFMANVDILDFKYT